MTNKTLTNKQLEKAARKYCELSNLDPDASVAHGAEPNEHGFVTAILLYSPQWKLVVPQIINLYNMTQSIDFALFDEKKEDDYILGLEIECNNKLVKRY